MNKLISMMFVSLFFAVGCTSSDSTEHLEPLGSNAVPAPVAQSGSRIQVQVTQTTTSSDDGAAFVLTSQPKYFDTKRSEECVPMLAADGTTRCLPKEASVPLDVYSNTTCTLPAVQVYTPDGCTPANPPKYIKWGVPPAAGACFTDPTGFRIYTVSTKPMIGYWYLLNGACMPAGVDKGITMYPATAEVDASEFASMSIQTATLVAP